MKQIRRAGYLIALMFCLCVPPSMASNGMVLIGYGAKARGMGGVGLALTEDSLVTAVNPAGTSFVGDRADAGLLVFNPKRRAACCLAPDGQVSDKAWFFIPNMAATYQWDEKIGLGFGFVGYGGGRTQYNPNLFDTVGGNLGVELSIAMMSPTVSYKIADDQSVGASLLVGLARFKALGLQQFEKFSEHPDEVHGNGFNWSHGIGLRVGWLGKFNNDQFSLAAVYQTEVDMEEFNKYRGLFAEEGNLDLPAVASLGMSYKVSDELKLAFDWSRTFYEDVPSIGNRALPIVASSTDPRSLGADGGPGFGWENQDVFKLGAQYQYDPEWVIRAGINYGKQPIRNETGGGEFEFNVLAPAVTELHLTAGTTYSYNDNLEFSFAIMHAVNNKESQDVPSGTGLPFENQTIELEMEQWAWDFGLGYKF